MKILKRIFLGLILLTIFSLIFRGWIYRKVVTYKSIGNRTVYEIKEVKLAELINKKINDKKNLDISEVINIGLTLTSKQLIYSASKNENDPNKLIATGKAHCVGYASFFASICNYMLQKKGLANEWIALPQKGQLYFLDNNVHNYLISPFFKDHDFVIIKNKNGGEDLAVDPTLHDYFYIDYIVIKK